MLLEQDAAQRRDQRTQEFVALILKEEQLKLSQQYEHMRIGFDLEAIRFEKLMHEKACDFVRAVKSKHNELLINLHHRIDQIKINARGPTLEQLTQL